MLKSLYEYLSSVPPDDGYGEYCEVVLENLSEEFFKKNETWIVDETEQIDKWINKLFNRGIDPIMCGVIIERSFKIYCSNEMGSTTNQLKK